MGSFANTLFSGLLGWVESLARAVWNAFSSGQSGTFLTWIGKNWMFLAAGLCAIGLIFDLSVYMVRWRPYRVWRSFWQQRRRNRETEAESEENFNTVPMNGTGPEDGAPVEADYAAGEVTVTASGACAAAMDRNDFGRWEATETEATTPGTFTEAADRNDFNRWEATETEETAVDETVPRGYRTPAGYYVPADSPYRRPEPSPEERENRQERFSTTEEIERALVRSGRRRRAARLMREFSDDARGGYPAVEDLINADEAYFKPVYPQKWQERDRAENGE